MRYTMVIFSQLYNIEQQRMTFSNMSHEVQQMSSPIISQKLKITPDVSAQITQMHKAPLDYPATALSGSRKRQCLDTLIFLKTERCCKQCTVFHLC